MKMSYQKRLVKAKKLFEEAEYIIIGGGAGLSAAAGLTYYGERFTKNFDGFIMKYGLTDMYSAGFYPFGTPEEKWAYWSRHIYINRYRPPALPLYKQLYQMVIDKNYFIVTTNVDYQFYKADFSPVRIFAVQGDYGKFQCSKGCHNKLYNNEEIVSQMVKEQKNCRIPSCLVPKCPVCGEDMEVNIRKDIFFVQDSTWYNASSEYNKFLSKACNGKTVLFEFGVGYNTPTIIRYPFDSMAYRNKVVYLIRFNAEYPEAAPENEHKTVSFDEDINIVLHDMSL